MALCELKELLMMTSPLLMSVSRGVRLRERGRGKGYCLSVVKRTDE